MQTEFSTYSKAMILGQIADTSINQIDSYAAEAPIVFGIAVKRGTDKQKQILPLDNIEEFLGLAIRDDLCRDTSYPIGRVVSVLTRGRVVVKTSEAAIAGDKAYVHADGKFNKTADDGLEIGVFTSTQSEADNLIILEIK